MTTLAEEVVSLPALTTQLKADNMHLLRLLELIPKQASRPGTDRILRIRTRPSRSRIPTGSEVKFHTDIDTTIRARYVDYIRKTSPHLGAIHLEELGHHYIAAFISDSP